MGDTQKPDLQASLALLVPAGIAVVSLYFAFRAALTPPVQRPFVEALSIVQSLVVAGVLLGLTFHHWRSQYKHDRPALYFSGWCLTGWIVLALVTQLLVIREVAPRLPINEVVVIVSDVALTGAMLGSVIGTYDARRRDQQYELANLTEFQDTLLKALRHDIRNDANVISGYIELLWERVAEDPDAGTLRVYVDTIEQKITHIIDLTHTSRELTETHETTTPDTDGGVPLDTHLGRAVEYGHETFPDAEITVEDHLPEVAVKADPLLDSLFENLSRNAIQHNNQSQPKVVVQTEVSPDVVHIKIADNGPGIPDEVRNQLFQEGAMGDESSGTGLGLYLVSRLLERYGGDIEFDENTPRGTVVTVTLRRANAPSSGQAAAVATDAA